MATYPWTGESADVEAEARLLGEAHTEAQQIASDFNSRWSSSPLNPEVVVEQSVGSGDQPIFVFLLSVDLDDDLDLADFPGNTVDELTSDLRASIVGTSVDGWAWIVSVAAKATLADW